MKVLVVGGGGREHALAWKATHCPKVEVVYVAPGNVGSSAEERAKNVEISATDTQGLLNFAKQQKINLTLVGPEIPLVEGIVDMFTAEGLPCFGPSKAAAILEGSKSFCKDFLIRHNIPTAAYQSFVDADCAMAYISNRQLPIVIKADELAGGKGVLIAKSHDAAKSQINKLLSKQAARIVIEDFLPGEEVSFMVVTDGQHVLPLATSQDHKARDNGDLGPNTGGMGAYCPAPIMTPDLFNKVMNEIIYPTIDGMAQEGRIYRGVLYAGLMVSNGQPKVLEFNCRFGDPEAQVLLMRLKTDLIALCEATLAGKLDTMQIDWDPRAALAVVLAAEGYPEALTGGAQPISGLDTDFPPTTQIFHAATRYNDADQVITAGGRVLAVTTLAKDISSAQQQAYKDISHISWPGAFYRTDIGYKVTGRSF